MMWRDNEPTLGDHPVTTRETFGTRARRESAHFGVDAARFQRLGEASGRHRQVRVWGLKFGNPQRGAAGNLVCNHGRALLAAQ